MLAARCKTSLHAVTLLGYALHDISHVREWPKWAQLAAGWAAAPAGYDAVQPERGVLCTVSPAAHMVRQQPAVWQAEARRPRQRWRRLLGLQRQQRDGCDCCQRDPAQAGEQALGKNTRQRWKW